MVGWVAPGAPPSGPGNGTHREAEDREAKEQVVTVNGKGDDRGQAGNNWRDSHKRGMENHP